MADLSIKNLVKTFGKFTAVDDFSLHISSGEIHALVGENGAGKSTVMKCLYGIYSPDSGSFSVDGKTVSIHSPRDAMRVGIGMVHQHFMLVPSMSVCRNVTLGDEPRSGLAFDEKRAEMEVSRLIDDYGLDISPSAIVGDLPVGHQQQVEILKLLYRNADILIFDEPTAVLSPKEVERLFETLRGFRQAGKTVIFIAHNLNEVLAISDTVSVMRKGSLVDTRARSDLDKATLAELMVGRAIKLSVLDEAASLSDAPVLSVKNLSLKGSGSRKLLDGLSFDVWGGEILGVAGITGNGQSELEEVISGLCFPDEGSVLIDGADVTSSSVFERRSAGLSYIPEDRIKTGLAPLANLVDNSLIGYQYDEKFRSGPFVKSSSAVKHADKIMGDYGVAAAHRGIQSGTLSGGNMQRLVMGRELSHSPSVLLVSQPTRGVDVGGAEEIHSHILRLRSEGSAVLLISSDLDEVLSLSDRVAVMFKGKIVALLSRSEADRDRIGRLMLEGGEEDSHEQ